MIENRDSDKKAKSQDRKMVSSMLCPSTLNYNDDDRDDRRFSGTDIPNYIKDGQINSVQTNSNFKRTAEMSILTDSFEDTMDLITKPRPLSCNNEVKTPLVSRCLNADLLINENNQSTFLSNDCTITNAINDTIQPPTPPLNIVDFDSNTYTVRSIKSTDAVSSNHSAKDNSPRPFNSLHRSRTEYSCGCNKTIDEISSLGSLSAFSKRSTPHVSTIGKSHQRPIVGIQQRVFSNEILCDLALYEQKRLEMKKSDKSAKADQKSNNFNNNTNSSNSTADDNNKESNYKADSSDKKEKVLYTAEDGATTANVIRENLDSKDTSNKSYTNLFVSRPRSPMFSIWFSIFLIIMVLVFAILSSSCISGVLTSTRQALSLYNETLSELGSIRSVANTVISMLCLAQLLAVSLHLSIASTLTRAQTIWQCAPGYHGEGVLVPLSKGTLIKRICYRFSQILVLVIFFILLVCWLTLSLVCVGLFSTSQILSYVGFSCNQQLSVNLTSAFMYLCTSQNNDNAQKCDQIESLVCQLNAEWTYPFISITGVCIVITLSIVLLLCTQSVNFAICSRRMMVFVTRNNGLVDKRRSDSHNRSTSLLLTPPTVQIPNEQNIIKRCCGWSSQTA